jgi:hypothetical protein
LARGVNHEEVASSALDADRALNVYCTVKGQLRNQYALVEGRVEEGVAVALTADGRLAILDAVTDSLVAKKIANGADHGWGAGDDGGVVGVIVIARVPDLAGIGADKICEAIRMKVLTGQADVVGSVVIGVTGHTNWSVGGVCGTLENGREGFAGPQLGYVETSVAEDASDVTKGVGLVGLTATETSHGHTNGGLGSRAGAGEEIGVAYSALVFSLGRKFICVEDVAVGNESVGTCPKLAGVGGNWEKEGGCRTGDGLNSRHGGQTGVGLAVPNEPGVTEQAGLGVGVDPAAVGNVGQGITLSEGVGLETSRTEDAQPFVVDQLAVRASPDLHGVRTGN